jgi:hypothetical protein
MDNDKSILEKITDTVKDIANIAADAANHALKAEQPLPKADERAFAYMPLAADGLVSNPMMLPVAMAPPRKKKRAVPKPVLKTANRKTAKESGKNSSKSATKSRAKKAATRKSKKATKRLRKKPARNR